MAKPERNLRGSEKIVDEQQTPILIQGEESPSFAPAKQAFNLLRVVFVVIPLAAGIDKFFDLLTNWDNYLSPSINGAVGLSGHSFMEIVGVIEIIAGFGVVLMPRIFGNVVAAWLIAIAANLIFLGGHSDIVVRDLGLALSAFALARLGAQFESTPRRLQSLQ